MSTGCLQAGRRGPVWIAACLVLALATFATPADGSAQPEAVPATAAPTLAASQAVRKCGVYKWSPVEWYYYGVKGTSCAAGRRLTKQVAFGVHQLGYGRRFTASGFRCRLQVEETLGEWTCSRGSTTVVIDNSVF